MKCSHTTSIPLLLTATVNPRGMVDAAFTVAERARQYQQAVAFYLEALPADGRIVFAENSASITAVSRCFEGEERVEWVDATQLDAPYAYDQMRGKGYNEWLLLHHAVRHSQTIAEAGCFFKLTGRLQLLNIKAMLSECRHRDSQLRFLADCKDHNVYQLMRIHVNAHTGECRYFYCTTEFFLKEVFPGYDRMYDYYTKPEGYEQLLPDRFLAEDLMLSVCRRARRMAHCYDRFRTQARITGRGGHDLGQGSRFFVSTDNDSPILRFKAALRQLIRWLLPWWRA